MSSELPVQQMQDVNWDKITEQQAASFALQLGLYNDACEAESRAKAVMLARLSSLVVATIVGISLLSWTSPVAAVSGMAGALGLSTVVSAWHARQAKKIVIQAAATLKEDVSQLPHE